MQKGSHTTHSRSPYRQEVSMLTGSQTTHRRSVCRQEVSLHKGRPPAHRKAVWRPSGDLARKYQVSQWELTNGQSLVDIVYRTRHCNTSQTNRKSRGRQEVSEETIPGRARRDLKRLHCVAPRDEDTQLIQSPSNIHWLVVTESTWLRTRQRLELVQLDWMHQPSNPITTPTTCRASAIPPPSKTLLTNEGRCRCHPPDVLIWLYIQYGITCKT